MSHHFAFGGIFFGILGFRIHDGGNGFLEVRIALTIRTKTGQSSFQLGSP